MHNKINFISNIDSYIIPYSFTYFDHFTSFIPKENTYSRFFGISSEFEKELYDDYKEYLNSDDILPTLSIHEHTKYVILYETYKKRGEKNYEKIIWRY